MNQLEEFEIEIMNAIELACESFDEKEVIIYFLSKMQEEIEKIKKYYEE